MHDPATVAFLGQYGEYGDGPGLLRMPMGLVVTDLNLSIVTDGNGSTFEIYQPPKNRKSVNDLMQ